MSFESSANNKNESISWSDYQRTMRTAVQQISVILPVYNKVDKFINISLDLKIKNSQIDFRAFVASTIEHFRFNAQGMAIESQMLMDKRNVGLRINEVSIDVLYDVKGFIKKLVYPSLEVLLLILKDTILMKNILFKILQNEFWGVYFEDCIFYKYTCARSLV
ncbi:dolichyl-phosphate mannose synthase related protein (plasmid) [Methanosarcina barkeri str. Wiesmoor]|uniref:Dolichyl-phosphate mannose synthase related protein n=1 Tax=Methanosarcina barkeri str. Wiesmoor TaxID=1434109 RepID=A0A0E3QHX3_METBA|nr:hypothetical protein [Methanosarcina barkeri]AKB49268.1 dolichyl-phosphate mannose synthase related protein [Methanosarcina barkeri str. Wiesmoor]